MMIVTFVVMWMVVLMMEVTVVVIVGIAFSRVLTIRISLTTAPSSKLIHFQNKAPTNDNEPFLVFCLGIVPQKKGKQTKDSLLTKKNLFALGKFFKKRIQSLTTQ